MAASRSTLPPSDPTLNPAERVRRFRPAWSSYLVFVAPMLVFLLPPLVRGLNNGAADRADWQEVRFWALVVAAWFLYLSRIKVVFGPDHVSYFSLFSFYLGPKSLRYGDIARYEASAIFRGAPARLKVIPKPESGRRPIRISLKLFRREQISEMLALLHARVPHPAPAAALPAAASPLEPAAPGAPAAAVPPPAGARKPWQAQLGIDWKWTLALTWIVLAAVSAYAGVAHRAVLIPGVFFLLSALGVVLYFLLRPKYDFVMASNQELRSGLGFAVRLDPPRLQYGEGNRVITVTAQQPPAGASHFPVSDDMIRAWDPPFQNEPLPRRKAARIRKNIAAAMAFMHAQRRHQSSPR